MRRLTENEIRFIKETGVTATVIQCDEWDRSQCSNYADAEKLADEKYGINLHEFLSVLADVNYDSISLEYDAVYLLYTFLTREELENMNDGEVLEWLKDFKYWCGYRKYDIDLAYIHRCEALEVYDGTREFYETDDGEVWNREIEE